MSRQVKIIGLIALGVLLIAGIVALIVVRAEQQRQAEEYVSTYTEALENIQAIELAQYIEDAESATSQEAIDTIQEKCTATQRIADSLPSAVPRLNSEQHERTEGQYRLEDFRNDAARYAAVCEYTLPINTLTLQKRTARESAEYRALLTSVNCVQEECFDTDRHTEFANVYEQQFALPAQEALASYQALDCPFVGESAEAVCQAVIDYLSAEVEHNELYVTNIREDAAVSGEAHDLWDEVEEAYATLDKTAAEASDVDEDDSMHAYYLTQLRQLEARFAQ